MYTKAFTAIAVLALLLSPNIGGAFIDRLSQEVSSGNMPTSRQQLDRQVERQVFGDFDALVSSIG